MKRIITLGIVFGLLFSALPALASSQVRTEFVSDGFTYFTEAAMIRGCDYSEGSKQVTGFVMDQVTNDGSIYLNKETRSPGEWQLQSDKEIWASGFTDSRKEVAWWTEDSTVEEGYLKYPTEVSIYTYFEDDYMSDEEEFYNRADMPPAEGEENEYETRNYFTKQWLSYDEDVYQMDSVGINLPTRCDHTKPEAPNWPTCIGEDC
ncbi:MAG: hypothetical protein ABEK17_04310 [Candidatus Aenigmatarchaeota archaeon]